jgi:CubicO group peptidase (beta-lactamase class C family)
MRFKKANCWVVAVLIFAMLACNMPGGTTSTQPPATKAAAAVPDKTSVPVTPVPGNTQPVATEGTAPILVGLATAPPGKYDWSKLDAALAGFVPNTVKGLTFMLAQDGQVLFSKAYGDQGLDTVQPIGFSTKLPSALAILTLVDEGKLKLDDPVANYLQGKIEWPADKSAITMRMLLNNTSGLQGDPDCVKNKIITLQECAQQIANAPVESTPGSQFAYGNGGYQVAGYIAEVLSGTLWEYFFKDRIARPLVLPMFTYGRKNNQLGSGTNPHIGGGAASDVNDYTKILQMFLAGGKFGGKQILSPEIIAEMQKDQIAGLPKTYSPGEDLLPGYSFGLFFTDPQYLLSSKGPELSDQGQFGFTPWVDLALNYSAVLLIKAHAKDGTKIWGAIRPLIIEQLTK